MYAVEILKIVARFRRDCLRDVQTLTMLVCYTFLFRRNPYLNMETHCK